MSFLGFVRSLFGTAASFLTESPAPTAPGSNALEQYLLSQSISIKIPRTGGVINEVTPAIAARDAAAIRTCAVKYGRTISSLTALVEQESRGSDTAENPNRQEAKPGETALEAFEHTDEGELQLDGRELEAMPENKGLTIAQIRAKAFDPAWAMDVACKMLNDNDRGIAKALAAEPALLKAIPNGDVRIACFNAYNKGVLGTVLELRAGLPLTYGEQVVARADRLAPILDVT